MPALDGRGPNGQFQPGNTLGRGHVVNRKISELRRVALASETPEQVAAVIGKMREQAMEGDTTAARIYIETMIGKPVQGVEISGPDGSPPRAVCRALHRAGGRPRPVQRRDQVRGAGGHEEDDQCWPRR